MTRKFTFLATFILLTFFSSKAAVVYVNPNPDINYNTNGAQNPGIDLDNNGTIDIKFRLDFQGAPGMPNAEFFYHTGGLTNGSQGIMDQALGLNPGGGAPYYKILTAGTVIGPASANFASNTGFPEPLLGDADNINIINAGDCIIGLKFLSNGNTHYAWVRVNLTGNVNNLVPNIIKDWAYESTPNTAINAGDMGSGATNVAVTGITVNSQGGASTITSNDGTLQMTTTIAPANATNQAVTWSVTPTGLATINATGLLTAQANGTVTVKATAQDGSNVSGNKTITISGQTVGIKEINRLASSIYPNPVKNEVMLQFGKEEAIRNIRISNIVGQVVYKNDNAVKSKLITINTASLPEGLYILTFENAEGKQGLQKFVKNK